MDKKIKILIICALIVIMLICIIKNVSKKELKANDQNNYEYSNVKNEYIIYNSDGDVIANTPEEAMIKVYQEDPTYNPGKTQDKDFIDVSIENILNF